MIKTLMISALAGGTGFLGWIGGSIWPAPPEWTDTIDRSANDLRAKLRLQDISVDRLQALMPAETFDRIQSQISAVSMAAGQVIMVEHDSGTLEEQLDNLAMDQSAAVPEGMRVVDVPAAPAPPPAPTPSPAAAPQPGAPPATPNAAVVPPPRQVLVAGPVGDAAYVFDAKLELCPRMTVSNAPSNADGFVSAFKPLVLVQGVRVATFPTPGACMSSGFGQRSDRLHKGVDYHADIGVPVLAGGEGAVVEMKYRDDYGNMLLIDHGAGVYTRYAHLASFAKGLTPGVTVKAGEQLGLMGNSASYAIPMHLHYELLVGDYANPKGSFGLEPVDPLSFPAAN
jgi:murein DD-endopeptidase MepM/ murein hydrolase activator NlpD